MPKILPPVPCDRCGAIAEKPVEMVFTTGYITQADVKLCVDCIDLYVTDRHKFKTEGWEQK